MESGLMLALVTCGPAYEPIDAVRRITNHSTGELGALLSDSLADAGHEVLCLRGQMSTSPPPTHAKVEEFTTNDSLETALRRLSGRPGVVFHAAALCDFGVAQMQGATPGRKIRSDAPALTLTLRPAAKILPLLRVFFPHALIVGWKYELDGSREEAITRARVQIANNRTNACVVNGDAYGPGFGLLAASGADLRHFPDKLSLCGFLAGDFLNS